MSAASTTAPVTEPVRAGTSARPPVALLPALATTAVVAVASGAATSWGQLLLPSALTSLTNSAGAWSLVAFGLVWWTRSRPAVGAALGVVAFCSLNVGYALASAARGHTWSLSPTNFWVAAGLLAGPLVGLGAAWARGRADVLAAVGIAGLAGLLVGEGVYGLTVIADTTSPVYWSGSVLAGLAVLVVLGRRRLRGPLPMAVATVGTLATASALLGAYALLNGSS
ncbi:DUF6518 family protein [Modestobacter sp. SSW1-42]|uniref:DUF6518 family protein n=1 Tax=Modestobacter sp. SSW1-42 TaxID=596372 RepID=UPI0039868C51